jgi:phosphatidylcholine synthase
MLALEAVYQGRAKTAIFFLLLTQIIDGVDGPMARSCDVKTNVPKVDGYVLDLVIDYFTCVVVPAMFLHKFDLLPDGYSLLIVGGIVFMSAIWFARTDMMTEDNWFRGFPATWNLIAPTLLVMGSSQWANAAIVGVLAALMLTNVKFPHPVRVTKNRWLTLPMTVMWLTALAWGTCRYPTNSMVAQSVLWFCIGYYMVICYRKTVKSPN